MYEQCLWTSDMLSKIAGQWSASLILHDSTRVFRTLGYCRLARFLCKLNIGRKRVNITSNLDSSYTFLTGIKETINHCKKELHIWSCRRPKNPPLGARLWKNYSVTLKNFYLQLCWVSKHQICSVGKPPTEEFIEQSLTCENDVIITWLWRRKRLSRYRLLVIMILVITR